MTTIGYSMTSSCRMCGGPVEHIASGVTDGRSTRAAMKCVCCGQKHLLVAELQLDDRPPTGAERAELSRRRRGLVSG